MTPAIVDHLRLPQVLKATGYSRATLYRRISDGEFPKARRDGRITYWRSDEVATWQAGRA